MCSVYSVHAANGKSRLNAILSALLRHIIRNNLTYFKLLYKFCFYLSNKTTASSKSKVFFMKYTVREQFSIAQWARDEVYRFN